MKGEWVSVKDRLPEKSEDVLIINNCGLYLVLRFSTKYQLFNAYDNQNEESARQCAITSVIHWMPLPEPPKEGDNE